MPEEIINTIPCEPYYVRPGEGSVYSHIHNVTITDKGIRFNINSFFEEGQPPSTSSIEITDMVCIDKLSMLLRGEISCFDALADLSSYLCKKHNHQLRLHPDPVIRMRILLNALSNKADPFIDFLFSFPHLRCFESGNMIYTKPIIAADDNIIHAIKQFIFDHATLQTMAFRFIQKNYSLFANKIDTVLPEFLANQIKVGNKL